MPKRKGLDSLDRAILGALAQDSRSTLSELSILLEKPPGTIRDRITSLYEKGVIDKFTIKISDKNTRFIDYKYVLVTLLSNNHSEEQAIIKYSIAENQILYCDYVQGDVDFILYIGCYSNSCTDRILDDIKSISHGCKLKTVSRIKNFKNYSVGIEFLV